MKEEDEELDVPNYNININLSPEDVGELDWTSNINYLFNKQNGQVPVPAYFYDALLDRCRYNASAFIHFN